MPDFLRAYVPADARASIASAEPGSPIRLIGSTENVGRDGLIIDSAGWQLDNFRANPIVLFSHRYTDPPIGRAEKVWVENKRLMFDVVLDVADPFAREIDRKLRAGFLSSASVGWDTLQMEPTDNPKVRGKVTKAELLDLSLVSVPGDPLALAERGRRGLETMARDILKLLDTEETEHRAAIPVHGGPKADENASWDGPGEEAKAEAAAGPLRRMHAWVNSDGDPDAKGSYRLPHHTAEGAVVLRGVMAGMARLMQAATNIPDADRRGVYNHLAAHYRQFDKEPPEFRSNAELDGLGPSEIRGLFLHGEPDLVPAVFDEIERRGAAVLSARNEDDLNQAIRLIRGVIARAGQDDPAGDDGEERSVRLLHSAIMAGAAR